MPTLNVSCKSLTWMCRRKRPSCGRFAMNLIGGAVVNDIKAG
jgi:hypothetical protein